MTQADQTKGALDWVLFAFGIAWTVISILAIGGAHIWLYFNDPVAGHIIIRAGDEPTLLGKWLDPNTPWNWIVEGLIASPAIVALAWYEGRRKRRERSDRY